MGNHFLIQRKNGDVIHIYHMKGNGICTRRLKAEEHPEILLRDGFYDFDCWYDDAKDSIHIMCQTGDGSITHILYEEETWKKKELLKGKLKLPYPKHFRVQKVGEVLCCVYTIRHDGNMLLVSQNGAEVPTVIDYVKDDSLPFCFAVMDGVPCVLYVSGEGS